MDNPLQQDTVVYECYGSQAVFKLFWPVPFLEAQAPCAWQKGVITVTVNVL
jgi:hypothetical protein